MLALAINIRAAWGKTFVYGGPNIQIKLPLETTPRRQNKAHGSWYGGIDRPAASIRCKRYAPCTFAGAEMHF